MGFDIPVSDTPAAAPVETPLVKARRKLALWEAAEDAIGVAGQEYWISDRRLTRADLGEVQRMVRYYEGEVARLSVGRRRGARVIGLIPYDV